MDIWSILIGVGLGLVFFGFVGWFWWVRGTERRGWNTSLKQGRDIKAQRIETIREMRGVRKGRIRGLSCINPTDSALKRIVDLELQRDELEEENDRLNLKYGGVEPFETEKILLQGKIDMLTKVNNWRATRMKTMAAEIKRLNVRGKAKRSSVRSSATASSSPRKKS